MKKIVFGILFIGLCSAFMHEYYVSIFRLTFKKDERLIQGEMKVFTDDLELLLKTNGYGALALENKAQEPKILKGIKTELLKSFSYLDAKEKPKQLDFLGYEVEGDMTWVYFTINNVKTVKNPSLTIEWMLGVYPGQVNIVHFYTDGEERSEYFSADKKQIKFLFSE